jgi:hypothetical protein
VPAAPPVDDSSPVESTTWPVATQPGARYRVTAMHAAPSGVASPCGVDRSVAGGLARLAGATGLEAQEQAAQLIALER